MDVKDATSPRKGLQVTYDGVWRNCMLEGVTLVSRLRNWMMTYVMRCVSEDARSLGWLG